MSRSPRVTRWVARATIALAGSGVFVLDSCDPTVKATLLTGFESASTGLATTLISAIFQKWATEDESTSTTPSTTT